MPNSNIRWGIVEPASLLDRTGVETPLAHIGEAKSDVREIQGLLKLRTHRSLTPQDFEVPHYRSSPMVDMNVHLGSRIVPVVAHINRLKEPPFCTFAREGKLIGGLVFSPGNYQGR